jgi:bifunctional UDP-N-acetylglucosamine pyrophosphorylase/glucosamine-1-phosphate N-acetyltransferase
MKITAMILAAGRGVRMKSDKTKVLHEVAGKPMLAHVVDSCLDAGVTDIVLIAGANYPEIKEFVKNNYTNRGLTQCVSTIKIVIQRQQLGTADAVKAAMNAKISYKPGVLILSGDVPLIAPVTIRELIKEFTSKKCGGIICTSKVKNPRGYGRIVAGRDGAILRIVEDRSASPAEKKIGVINSGIYVFEKDLLKEHIRQVRRDPIKKEYYLTDLIEIMAKNGIKIRQKDIDHAEAAGINDRVQLMEANSYKNKKNLEKLAKNGITIEDFATVFIDENVSIGKDTVIKPFTVIKGKTKIGRNCMIGPSAHIRPDTVIGNNCKIGNYVEIKKSIIGNDTNVGHMSYIGDAVLGDFVNIGAGTITANYDGKRKNRTVIGNHVFVGSNTVFVAPVVIGDNVTVAAGSVITENVPSRALAIARCRQTVKKNWNKK